MGGRYLGIFSAELTHWLTDVWGAAAFVDAGDACDSPHDLRLAMGYGLGARWRSPAGRSALIWPMGNRRTACSCIFRWPSLSERLMMRRFLHFTTFILRTGMVLLLVTCATLAWLAGTTAGLSRLRQMGAMGWQRQRGRGLFCRSSG